MIAATRRSPIARLSASLGASVETEAGWEIAAHYGDEAAERALLRDLVAVADVTPRGKIDLRGEIDGGVLTAAGEVLTARMWDGWALLLTEPGGEEAVLDRADAAAGPRAMATDVTHLFAGLALAGPKLEDALARLTSWDPSTLAPGSATGASIGDVRAVLVRRDIGIPVLEAYVATEFARYAWETVLGVVRRLGGGPAGWRALRAEGWS
ncbi:MAG: hypothetical protein HY240_00645 [Actinobacteria bacterium]|nr:hypothetical protein [Actinomycetota bacterium]